MRRGNFVVRTRHGYWEQKPFCEVCLRLVDEGERKTAKRATSRRDGMDVCGEHAVVELSTLEA